MLTLPSELTIRRAREGDLPEMARIHYAAFPDHPMTLEQRIAHFKDDPRMPFENHWVCIRRGVMAGLLALYDFRMFRGGKAVPTGGIGRVAVAPEARRERVAYWLMAHAISVMDQNGVPLSILYPFRHSFYRRLGWGLIGRTALYRFPPAALPSYPERSAVQPMTTAEEREEVMGCYQRYAETHNGPLERPEPVWIEHIFKNGVCYLYRCPDSGQVDGYLIYFYRHPAGEIPGMHSNIEVRELVWNSPAAFRGLVGFLSAQGEQVRSIAYSDQSGLSFAHLLNDPLMIDGRQVFYLGSETARLGSGLMGRVVQLRRALAVGGFGKGDVRVTFKIADELNPKNSDPLTVEFNDGRVDFPTRGGAPVTISTDIATFSSIYWGALPLRQAHFLGMVETQGADDLEKLERLFFVPGPICLDYF